MISVRILSVLRYEKRCQFVVKVNILSSDLIGRYLTLNLNQPIKWTDFRLDALLADTMLTKLYATGHMSINSLKSDTIMNTKLI
jgi:hypothetical protein